MYFRPGLHKEAGLVFSPIKAIVSPRPIGWISSCGKDGSINLAPYSYFNAISELPPMVMFSSAPSGNAQHKDSLRNVIETEEFVVNIVSAALGDAMNVTSADLAYGQSEFAAAPAALECKLWKVIELPKPETAGARTAGAGVMVIGMITGIHIADETVKDGKIDVTSYQPLARLGYMDYVRIDNVFAMPRPAVK